MASSHASMFDALMSGSLKSDSLPTDSEIWSGLKQAIASSSGFQRWQLEHVDEVERQHLSLDYQVRHYLRQTLETLAY